MSAKKASGASGTSTGQAEITWRNTGHLLRRAAFGATPDTVQAAARAGLAGTVESLINFQQTPSNVSPPDPAILTSGMGARIEPLTEWWLTQMVAATRPLQEKMTLFWHGHFATAFSKVRSVAYMYRQNQLFRDNALARFDDLLTAVYRDPAMLIWLDGRTNVKSAPNENFGREVMELFTVGVGNYTQDDVHASARAFTGWRIGFDGEPVFVPRLHDDGPKTLLGQTGNWTADDAVRILCAHPATGPFLAGKLWRFFASDQPPAAVIKRMAAAYYSSGHMIDAMVREMLNAPEFYSQTTRTTHIKSPTDFLVTTIRQLGVTQVDTTEFPRTLALLGQELFNPPNVGGWPGGASWINANTMLARFNFASRFSGDAPGSPGMFDPNVILNASNADSMSALIFFLAGALGISMSNATLNALTRYVGKVTIFDSNVDLPTKTRGLIHLMLASPEYQIS